MSYLERALNGDDAAHGEALSSVPPSMLLCIEDTLAPAWVVNQPVTEPAAIGSLSQRQADFIRSMTPPNLIPLQNPSTFSYSYYPFGQPPLMWPWPYPGNAKTSDIGHTSSSSGSDDGGDEDAESVALSGNGTNADGVDNGEASASGPNVDESDYDEGDAADYREHIADIVYQMMYVSGETGEPSSETTGMIEEIVRQQVIEIVSASSGS
jgi:hypothetical protein